jgi:hypothetical protein
VAEEEQTTADRVGLSASPRDGDAEPGAVDAWAAAVAGPAFAGAVEVFRGATFVPAGVFDGVAAALVAFGLSLLLHRRFGGTAATLLRGAGLVVSALLMTASLTAPWDRAAPPLALLLAGGALLQAGARPKASAAWTWAGGAVLAAAVAIGLFVAPDFPEPTRLRLTLVLGAIAAAGLLAARRWLLANGHEALAPSPAGLLAGAAVGATYLGYRELVAQRVGNLPLYEWSLGVLLSLLLLSRLRRGAREDETPEAWTSEARRHAQAPIPLYDARMGPLAAALARYLETGEGFEQYRAALGPSPRLDAILPAPIVPHKRGRAARREAYQQRLAAHRAALEAVTPPIRSR